MGDFVSEPTTSVRAAQWLTFLRTARARSDRRSDDHGRGRARTRTPLPLARNETRIGSRQTDLNLREGKVLEINHPILKWNPLPSFELKAPKPQ